MMQTHVRKIRDAEKQRRAMSPGTRLSSLHRLALATLLALLAACTTVQVPPAPGIEANSGWALLPILNHTETPQAGLRAEAILESIVRASGIDRLQRYPARLNRESMFDPVERSAVDAAATWARKSRLRYALTGTVDEWRYKVGVDGEPAIGVTLQLIDLAEDRVIWSAAGSKTGWSREGLSAVAQKLLGQLSAPLLQSARAAKPSASR